ncbi:MAG: murein biosynthesis integral membrane protein MurJ [Planctomycetota bacterium]|nr:murein biosynthesis integral membrane protein MurJ [Planctomycetota bacterium]
MNQKVHSEREHFFGAAKIVASLTMLSRVLGLVRDMVIVPLGSAVLADRFWTAFSVPNLFRRLFGEGAISAAFVPVFTEVAESEGWDRARLVLANVAGILAAVLGGLVVLIELGLWAAWTVWGDEWTRLVLLQLTGLMLPFMFTVCLLALGSAALNCRGHFAYPAFAPIILNVGLIVTAGLFAPALARYDAQQFYIIALGLLATGLVQLVGVIWLLRRAGLAAVPRLRPVLAETKKIARLMAPMVIPLSILQLSAFADRLLALIFTATARYPSLPLRDGIVRCLYAANRLYQLPLGVLAISIATVVFPLFSRYAARNDTGALRSATNRALRLGAFLGIPAGTALILLAGPATAMIFQRKNFTAFDTARAAFILQMYCLGMWAYFWNHVLLRAFFAQKDTRTPLILSVILAGVNLLLVVVGIFTPLRGGAIGLATAVTSSVNAIVLLGVLHRRWGGIGGGDLVGSAARSLLACMVMAVVLVLLRWQLAQAAAADWLILLACVPAGAAAFLLAARLLRAPELAELWGALRKGADETTHQAGRNV